MGVRVSGAGGAYPPALTAGYYYGGGASSASTAIRSEAQMELIPIDISGVTALDRIAIEVTTAGTSGALIRLGIYGPGGNGLPGSLLLDAGTVDATSTGVKEITIVTTLPRGGRYWMAAVIQGGAGTRPTTRVSGAGIAHGVGFATASVVSQFPPAGYAKSGITGALPSTVAPDGNVGTCHRVMVRAA